MLQKPSKEVLSPTSNSSILVRSFGCSAFDAPYHFHPEYELTYITQGCGKRFVGNSMADFEKGDFVLLGSRLPHCWKLNSTEKTPGGAVVVQFSVDCFGESFFDKPEMYKIQKMLRLSSAGICFLSDKVQPTIGKLLAVALEEDSFSVMISFLQILQQLSEAKQYRLLDEQNTVADWSNKEQIRMNAVYAYIVENFKDNISLQEVAAVAHLSPNAFCKYFKKNTRKTLMDTVIGYRISYAIQLLVHSDKSISEIAVDSGFGDESHFYKIFRSRMKQSPIQYRMRFRENLEPA